MRVLHTLAQLPMRTGSGVAFENMVRGFEKNGAENAIIYGFQEPFEFDFGLKEYPLEFKTDEVNFPIAGMSDEMPYENTVYSEMSEEMIDTWFKAFDKRLMAAKEEFNPELLICHHLWYLTSMALDIFEDIPVIGVCHSTDLRQAKQNPELFEKYVYDMNRLAHVFALSKENKDEIIKIFGVDEDKITIVGGGFNQDIFHSRDLKRPEDKIRIIYAGKIARAKGAYELAKAYPNLKRKHPELEMKFIGEAIPSEQEILYENAHYMDGFRIYNVKNQKELGDHMRMAHIFSLPSYYEGLGLTAIEALACKLRVVCSVIPGLMELLGDEVNESEVIDYVTLPEIYDQDRPVKSQVDGYVQRLEEALDKQIMAIKEGRDFPEDVYDSVMSHSWDEICEREYEIVKGLL